MDFEKLLADYDYEFPESAVALEPSTPRDAARLLVLEAEGAEKDDTFRNLAKHLPPRSVIVLNETRVIPARVEVAKPTGGKVRLLFVREANPNAKHWQPEARQCFVLADRPIEEGKPLAVVEEPFVTFTPIKRVDTMWLMQVKGVRKSVNAFKVFGRTPIPPYLKATRLREAALREKYQTVFASKRKEGSVAAPTASLHFTPRLLDTLKREGHDIVHVTLHVNLGTFAPLTPQHLAEGKLHEERYEITAAAASKIAAARKANRPIIAVGTTALRALESAAAGAGKGPAPLKKLSGPTRLFIQPGYKFKVIDGLITNFHVPKSSLLMLVSALVGRKRLMTAYKNAIARGYKIFSFGDGMLILPRRASDPRRAPAPRKSQRRAPAK